jgi:hypothetical protein
MVLAAGVTRPHLSTGAVVLVLAVLAVVWLVRLWLWPYGPCRRCGGDGRSIGSSKKRHGHCGGCGGTGRRWRLGSKQVRKAARRLRSARNTGKD